MTIPNAGGTALRLIAGKMRQRKKATATRKVGGIKEVSSSFLERASRLRTELGTVLMTDCITTFPRHHEDTIKLFYDVVAKCVPSFTTIAAGSGARNEPHSRLSLQCLTFPSAWRSFFASRSISNGLCFLYCRSGNIAWKLACQAFRN